MAELASADQAEVDVHAAQPLVIAGVTKRYGSGPDSVLALDEVSLSVEAGEIVALLGNNGAGKSTLMSVVAGLLPADSGSVMVRGESTTASGGVPSSHLGLAPQDEALYPTLTARRNLRYFGSLSGLRGRALEQRVQEVSQHLLLTGVLDRKASSLSGGQRRRLHTALALMHDPDVLLLDEPTVGVDLDARAELLEFVRSTAAKGAAILYSTHQLHEVADLGARVVIIDGGRILASGSVDDLIARHAPPLGELRFDSADVDLPADLRDAIDEAGWTSGAEYRLSVRLAGPDVHVTELLDALGDDARSHLRGATVVPPGLETAYRRLVRRTGSGGRSIGQRADTRQPEGRP